MDTIIDLQTITVFTLLVEFDGRKICRQQHSIVKAQRICEVVMCLLNLFREVNQCNEFKAMTGHQINEICSTLL